MQKNKHSSGALVVATLAALVSNAYAEVARAVREGAYNDWVAATLLRTGTDTLVVLGPESSRPETLAVDELGIVEVARGRRPRGTNMIRGFATGVVLGALVAGISYRIQYGDCRGELCGIGTAYYIGVGAAIGGGSGLAVGSFPVRSWDRIFVSPNARRWLQTNRWPR